MSEDKARDEELHELIEPIANRRLQKRRTRRKLFGKKRQERFLEHLAATCNVTASAAAADITIGPVYRQRMINPEFRAGWDAALEQGYARLEAALIERAERGSNRPQVHGDKIVDGPDSPAEIDWEKGMELLRHHRRGLAGIGKRGLPPPRRVPVDEVAAKLIKKLKALGVTVPDRSGASTRDADPPAGSSEA